MPGWFFKYLRKVPAPGTVRGVRYVYGRTEGGSVLVGRVGGLQSKTLEVKFPRKYRVSLTRSYIPRPTRMGGTTVNVSRGGLRVSPYGGSGYFGSRTYGIGPLRKPLGGITPSSQGRVLRLIRAFRAAR